MLTNTASLQPDPFFNDDAVRDKTINLLIIDDTFDSEEKIVSSLRGIGYTARSVRVEDEEDLHSELENFSPDLVIYFNGVELIDLATTCRCLSEHPNSTLSRVIAVDKQSSSSVVAALQQGATDLVSFDNIDHLLLVIKREFVAQQNARDTQSLQKALLETEKRCNSLLDSSRDAIAYVHEGMHVYSNQSYLELLGIDETDELEGMPILDMVSLEERDTFKAFLRSYAKSGDSSQTLQTQLRKANGEEFKGEMEFSPARIDNEPCIQIIIRQQNLNTAELEAHLKQLNRLDQFTNLFNRQYFIEELKSTIADCENGDYVAAIMEIKLDNFESIKETVGISNADKYIVAAADTLKNIVDDNNILARYTHSTFSLILKECNKASIQQMAGNLQTAISDLLYDIEGVTVNTTCSIGATIIDTDTPEFNDILLRLEKAVATATENGCNQFSLYVPEKGEMTRHESDARYKEILTEALKHDNFILHFQPIVSLHGDTDERYEVFVRLKDPGHDGNDLIMPNDFLPAAERTGMAIAVDRWVLYQTIKQITLRWKNGHTTRFVLKLSAASIKDETLVDWLSFQTKEKKLPAGSLAFVVKETVAVTNLKNTREIAEKVKQLNCDFILDDFGSGANPFQLLQHIPADYIRLDPGLMEELSENPHDQETIKHIAAQASEQGINTIAQHVPDAASLSILWGLGVNFIQGNFLQPPSSELNYDFSDISG